MILPSSVHGMGIFARENINKDERIEESPLLKMDWKLKYVHDKILRDYCWMNASCQCSDCKVNGPAIYLALGYGSLYNHHDKPNTNIKLDYSKLKMTVNAKEDISAGSEIFVSYGSRYFSSERRKINQNLITKEETNEEKPKHT